MVVHAVLDRPACSGMSNGVDPDADTSRFLFRHPRVSGNRLPKVESLSRQSPR
jgi:hypothetical protein